MAIGWPGLSVEARVAVLVVDGGPPSADASGRTPRPEASRGLDHSLVDRSKVGSCSLCVTVIAPWHHLGHRVLSFGGSMVVIPGLSESLSAVGKRIVRFDTTEALLSVEAASSARRARCPTCSHGSSRRHGQYRRRLSAQPCMGQSVSLSVEVRASSAPTRNAHRRPSSSRSKALPRPSNAVRSVSMAPGAPWPRRWADRLQLVYRQSWECRPVVTRCCASCVARVTT